MSDTHGIPRGSPLVRTTIADDELPSDAVLRAATDAGVECDRGKPLLYDYIDVDALNRLLSIARSRSRDSDLIVRLSLWELAFVATPQAVEVYPSE